MTNRMALGFFAVTLLAGTVFGEVMDGVRTDLAKGRLAEFCELDLSPCWEKAFAQDEDILWSSLGWGDVADAPNGKSVTLQLVPQSTGQVQPLTVEPLVGHRQIFVWSPGDVTKQLYTVRHVVNNGTVVETLNAYFSYRNGAAPSEAEMKYAVKLPDGQPQHYTIRSDLSAPWFLIGGAGDGIQVSDGEGNCLVTVSGFGKLTFDYALDGGACTVSIDGGEPVALAEAANWTDGEFAISGLGQHTILFSVAAGEDGFARIKGVMWADFDRRTDGIGVRGVQMDLREGVRVIRSRDELLPFVYSSTNFTGLAEADGQSVARITVVGLEGEGDALEEWEPVPGTEKVLKKDTVGEGRVVWYGRKGVWKAAFEIRTEGDVVHTETAIFDMRQLRTQVFFLYID